jgi:nucleotide-binding universal stress UspA family protein
MRILIATNGSSDNEELLCFGLRIARHAGEPLTILTVVEPKVDHLPHPMDALVAQFCDQLQIQPFEVRTKIRIGHAVEEILHEAEQGVYDLLIVAENQCRSPVRRWFPALTAVDVAERAPCSVVIVKGKAGAIRRILLCDSGANGPAAAPPSEVSPQIPSVSERFAARLVGLFGKEEEVTVLHVMSQISAGPGVRGKQLRAGAVELIGEHTLEGELLERDIQLLARSGIHSHPEVRHGLVVDEILAEAQSGDYDLVVIGAPAGKGWRRFLLDDLARQIVEQMDRPVLVVR